MLCGSIALTADADLSGEMTMSDLIRRQDAINAIGEKPVGDTDWDLGCRNQWEWDTEILRTLPTAEPERNKGHWIKHENPTFGKCMKIFYECSECHRGVGCEYFVRRSFCPNCGADMRG